METLAVRVVHAASDAARASIYQSLNGEPRLLAFERDDGVTEGAVYESILDLPDGAGGPPRARYLFVVGIELDSGHEADFEEWYNVEHLPALAEVPGVRRAARFRQREAARADGAIYPEYLALYELEAPEIAGNDDWKRAVNTPWTERLRPHFQARWRGGYERASRD